VVAKTVLPENAAMSQIRAVLKEMDPLIPIAESRSLRDVWSSSMSQEQLLLTLLGAFGSLALLLATVGVYTVVAQAARRRSREIGIRVALGATDRNVMSLVFNRGIAVVGAGLAIGLGIALAVSRVIASQLYEVEPSDPVTLSVVVLVLGGVALFACFIPARRAARGQPLETLRSE
jgi:ABC-type antimicrobial peptide transport system permease subunit